MKLCWAIVPRTKSFPLAKIQKKYQICKRKVHFYAKKEEKSEKFNEMKGLGWNNDGKQYNEATQMCNFAIVQLEKRDGEIL